MSLYSNPVYFQEHLLEISAPDETPPDVNDLYGSYKNVTNPDNYNNLERLRMKPNPKNKAETEAYDINQKTNLDMKLSSQQFVSMLKQFGYEAEGEQVLTFLRGIGEYDF